MSKKRVLVKKRKGHTEDFNSTKLKNSLVNAGLILEEADKLAMEIEKWADEQIGKIVHTIEIERKVIEHMRKKNKDALISFLAHARNKVKPIKKTFNRKDVAQMLTSLFVIIQIYVLETVKITFVHAMPVLLTSMLTCLTILWLIEGKQLWKHFVSGFLLVSLLAVITGLILDVNKANILIAISIGFPVAAMVDLLRN